MARSLANANQAKNIDGVPIGGTTPSTGAFTTLSASGAVSLLGTVSGAALTAYMASPAAIGGTAPAAGSFTNLSATGTLGATGAVTFGGAMTVTGAATLNGGMAVAGISALGGDVFLKCPTPTGKAAAATLTAAELLTGIVQYTGAAAALTFPLATALDAALPTLAVDQGVDFSVINTGTGAATMTANTGVTIVGAAAVTNGTSGRWRLRKSAASTYIAYRLS